jgi:hypothetical protein
MPRDTIMVEEGEETVVIPEKALLIFDGDFRSITLLNDLVVKGVHWLPKLVEMALL